MKKPIKMAVAITTIACFSFGNLSFASTGLTQQEKNDIYYACRGGINYKPQDNESIIRCRAVVKKVEMLVEKKGC